MYFCFLKNCTLDKLAVVILNWNGENLLKQFLPSVVEFSKDPGTTIYVIDNASTDNSLTVLKDNFPTVKIIVLDKNYGFPGGYNRGLKLIEAEYFILLNSDVEVTANWISPMLNLIEADKSIAAVQPKILSYQVKNEFEYAGAAGGFIDRFGFPFCRGRLFNVFEKDKGQYNYSDDIFWATGACLLVRAQLYNEIGGMDERFFAHMEEIDLCWRLKNRGYRIVYQGNSTIYHLGGATLSKTNPRKTYLNFRNNLYLLLKNVKPWHVFPIFATRFFLDTIAVFKFLIGGEFKNGWAVINAHLSFWYHLPNFIKSRYQLQKSNIIYNHSEIYNKSLVWDFFVKGKKYFHELRFDKGK